MQERVRSDLREAMRRRDQVTVRALRSLLAALANAEAVDPGESSSALPGSSRHVAGAHTGLYAGEVPRRELSDADVRALVEREVSERTAAAAQVAAAGHAERQEQLLAEASVLSAYLEPR